MEAKLPATMSWEWARLFLSDSKALSPRLILHVHEVVLDLTE